MSDSCDSDGEFETSQGLKLISNPTVPAERSNKPLGFDASESASPRKFEATFSGSFLDESLYAKAENGGFGDALLSEEEDCDNVVGLDWDASRIFKNIASSENNQEKSVCALRLHDILSKSELGILQMSRQMTDCGKLLNNYSEHQRRDLGFQDDNNIQQLLQLIRSLRSSMKLMELESEDLEELLKAKEHVEKSKFPMFSVLIGLGVTLIPAAVAAFYYSK